jgi:hypothetical protein
MVVERKSSLHQAHASATTSTQRCTTTTHAASGHALADKHSRRMGAVLALSSLYHPTVRALGRKVRHDGLHNPLASPVCLLECHFPSRHCLTSSGSRPRRSGAHHLRHYAERHFAVGPGLILFPPHPEDRPVDRQALKCITFSDWLMTAPCSPCQKTLSTSEDAAPSHWQPWSLYVPAPLFSAILPTEVA